MPTFVLGLPVLALLLLAAGQLGCAGEEEPNVDWNMSAAVESAKIRAEARGFIAEERYDDALTKLESLGASDGHETRELMEKASFEKAAKAALQKACTDPRRPQAEEKSLCGRIPVGSRYVSQGCCAGATPPAGNAKNAADGDASPLEESQRGSDDEAIDMAKRAIIGNDQAGCIRALREAPRTSRVVQLLISCYQRDGNMAAACNLARRHQSLANARQFAQARCR